MGKLNVAVTKWGRKEEKRDEEQIRPEEGAAIALVIQTRGFLSLIDE